MITLVKSKKLYLKSVTYFLLSIACLITEIFTIENYSKIKLYALCTPSHEILLYNWFLPSFQDNYELIIENYSQECPTAKFKSYGWIKTTLKKVELILQAIEENFGSIFIYSDLDIQFFKSTEKILLSFLKNNDFLIQRNSPSGEMCTGFFITRANEKTQRLWQKTYLIMLNSQGKISDQEAFNKAAKILTKQKKIKWNYLPNTFLTGYYVLKNEIPKDIILHHANYTVGIENKILQLRKVNNIVNYCKQDTSL